MLFGTLTILYFSNTGLKTRSYSAFMFGDSCEGVVPRSARRIPGIDLDPRQVRGLERIREREANVRFVRSIQKDAGRIRGVQIPLSGILQAAWQNHRDMTVRSGGIDRDDGSV